jgi:hydroxymethylbilane synthase
MIPAPAQAIIAAVCRSDDQGILHALSLIEHGPTAYVASVERSFLRLLGGGCESPVGGLATLRDTTVHFKGYVFHAVNGRHYSIDTTVERISSEKLAERLAEQMTKQIQDGTTVISENPKA